MNNKITTKMIEEEKALNLVASALNVASQKGCFGLKDSSDIHKALVILDLTIKKVNLLQVELDKLNEPKELIETVDLK